MTHAEFVRAHRSGTLRVRCDPQRAANFLSARLLLPFMMMPVIGVGIALALTGRVWVGLAVIALGIIVPRMIKRSAPRFLLAQALHDEKLYLELTESGVIAVNV
jgi:hypothetical protein